MAQLVTDRPDLTESAQTVGRKTFQIEAGFLNGFGNSVTTATHPGALFRLGISNSLELRLVTSYESHSSEEGKIHGMPDSELGIKWMLPVSAVQMALISHISFPTGTPGLSNGVVGSSHILAISHSLTDVSGLGYNIGFSHAGTGTESLNYSMAFGYEMGEKLGLFIELFGESIRWDDVFTNIDTGFTYLASSDVQFDFSVGTGINHRWNFISMGISWRIPGQTG